MDPASDANDLPPELAALEARLGARPRDESAQAVAALRHRVMRAVHTELTNAPRVASFSLWPWAAIAAAALIALNLSLVSGSATEFTGGLVHNHPINPLQEIQQIDKLEQGILR